MNGVNGLILLPDEWNLPDEIVSWFTFNAGVSETDYAEHNNYTLEQWQQLESLGAVFLPVTGMRYGQEMVDGMEQAGAYWINSQGGNTGRVGSLYFASDAIAPSEDQRAYAEAVRLVCDASNTPTALTQMSLAQVYTEHGRVVCVSDFRIYDLLGRDVTRQNGSLNGIYIVKTSETTQKVVVK